VLSFILHHTFIADKLNLKVVDADWLGSTNNLTFPLEMSASKVAKGS